jgi:hypothetical protein
MFSLIESKDEIAKVQRKLEKTICRDFKTKLIRDIGYPAGTLFQENVNTDGKYWYGSTDLKNRDVSIKRRLNWFGLLSSGSTALSITVEINTVYEGHSKMAAGFFGRDNDTGAVYLFHSGRVGGGTPGVGKLAFLACSNLPLTEVACSNGDIREGIVVMPVEGLAATRSLIRYIDIVVKFKVAARKGVMNSPAIQKAIEDLEEFFSESHGRRKGKRSSIIDYLSRHGEVVDALKEWRNSKSLPRGGRIIKNQLLDMGVKVGNKLIEVYEVKTNTGRSAIYYAIGQLMVHGKSHKCRRVIVLPNNSPIAHDLKETFLRINIELLRFKLTKKFAAIQ